MTLQVATAIGPAHAARAAASRTPQSAAQSQTAATGAAASSDAETDDPSSSFAELIHEISGVTTSSPDDAASTTGQVPLKGNARVATELADLPQPAAQDASGKNSSAVPVQTTHTRVLTIAEAKVSKTGSEQTAPMSILGITVPAPPVRLRLPVFVHSGEASQGDTTAAGKTSNHPATRSAERADTALHVTIRTPEHKEANPALAASSEQASANPSPSSAAETEQQPDQPDNESKSAQAAPDDIPISTDVNAVTASPASPADHTAIVASDIAANIATNMPAAEVSRAFTSPLPPPTAAVEVNAKQPDAPSQPATPPPARGSAPPPEPPSEQANQQPLRSVSLEFTPDGARDVRLRLSERGGEVHVSLHSTDPAFTGRLHEGVHDLIGSLTHAGYDAEAWSPDQGQQDRQRQPADSHKQRRNNAPDSGGDDFGGLLTQPIQEVS